MRGTSTLGFEAAPLLRLLVLDHNYVRRVAIVGGLVVTAGPVELKVWESSEGSYKLRPVRRVSVRFHGKGWVG